MTARKLLENTLKLLGYCENGSGGDLPQRIQVRSIPLINIIYSELSRAEGRKFKPVEKLNDEIVLSDTALHEIMPTGLAMLIAESESDADQQRLWAEIYAAKRATLTKTVERCDVIPVCEG